MGLAMAVMMEMEMEMEEENGGERVEGLISQSGGERERDVRRCLFKARGEPHVTA